MHQCLLNAKKASSFISRASTRVRTFHRPLCTPLPGGRGASGWHMEPAILCTIITTMIPFFCAFGYYHSETCCKRHSPLYCRIRQTETSATGRSGRCLCSHRAAWYGCQNYSDSGGSGGSGGASPGVGVGGGGGSVGVAVGRGVLVGRGVRVGLGVAVGSMVGVTVGAGVAVVVGTNEKLRNVSPNLSTPAGSRRIIPAPLTTSANTIASVRTTQRGIVQCPSSPKTIGTSSWGVACTRRNSWRASSSSMPR